MTQTWVPLADSGITFGLSLSAGVTLVGSTLTCTTAVPLACSIGVDVARTFRLTQMGWNYAGVSATKPWDYWAWNDDVNSQTNSHGSQAGWDPVEFQASVDAGDSINFRVGADVATPRNFAFLVEVLLDVAVVPPVTEPIGSATTARPSAYQRNRTTLANLVRGETRGLIADFNGILPLDRSIVSGVWQCDQYNAVEMFSASGTARTAQVMVNTPMNGKARLKVTVTLDNGEVYNHVFVVFVRGQPWFPGETGPFPNGPATLSFTV